LPAAEIACRKEDGYVGSSFNHGGLPVTFDEYNEAITRIHNELQAIADRTANQAVLGMATAGNPAFIALMRRHAQLTKLSSELTERMTAQM
jgi:hypothetical protein